MAEAATLEERARGDGVLERFLLLAFGTAWDHRRERGEATALAGALLLELLRGGNLAVQHGAFHLKDEPADPTLAAVAKELGRIGPCPTNEALLRLTRKAPELVQPWKDLLVRSGVLADEHGKVLGLLRRSSTRVVDGDRKARLEQRLTRFLAGSGVPDTDTLLLLGLLEASGTLERFLPRPTLPFNRRRIQGLITGRDSLGYRATGALQGLDETVLHAILKDVRAASRLPLG